jgi:hypothetical protein
MQLPYRPVSSRARFGGSLVPVLIVVAALVLSTAIFFLFTRKKMVAQKETEATAAVKLRPNQQQQNKNLPSRSPHLLPNGSQPPTPPPAPVSFGFARPLDLGKQLVRSLATGDFTTAGKLAAAADAAQSDSAAMLFKELSSMGYKPGTRRSGGAARLGGEPHSHRHSLHQTRNERNPAASSSILNVTSAWDGRSPRPCCRRK